MYVSRVLVASLIGILVVCVVFIICGGLVRQAEKEMMKTYKITMRKLPLLEGGFSDSLKTGDVVFMAFDFHPWSWTDIVYRAVEGFEEASFIHTGVVFVDDTNMFGLGKGVQYIYEYKVFGDNTVHEMYKRMRRFLPDRVAIRRVNSPVKNPQRLRKYMSKAFVSTQKTQYCRKGGVMSKLRYSADVVKRYALHLPVKRGHVSNCIDCVAEFLIEAGIMIPSDHAHLPLLHPTGFLMDKKVEGLPFISAAERVHLHEQHSTKKKATR